VTPSLANWVSQTKPALEGFFENLFQDAWPESFGSMCRYPLQSGGKRMRPLWVCAAYQAIRGDRSVPEGLLHAAAAMELIHTYSLVHDDLPCMDDDALRRGRPTVHIEYGEGPAVLVGDALLTEAFGLALRAPGLSDAQRVQIAQELAHVSGYLGMIGGQAADVGLGGSIEDVETLTRLHQGKTGALIRGSCRLGAFVAGANEDELQALTAHGEAIGLAFQLADDVLDAEEDAGDDGPPSYVKLMGLEPCKAKADSLFQESLQALGRFGEQAAILRELAAYTIQREI
jgi:geranylgeranyl pyrophosphate synthase